MWSAGQFWLANALIHSVVPPPHLHMASFTCKLVLCSVSLYPTFSIFQGPAGSHAQAGTCSLQHHCALASWGSETFLFFCAWCWGVQTTDEQRSYSLFPSLLVHRKSENDKGKGSSIRVPYVEGEEIFRGNRSPRHYLKTLRTTVSPDKCIDWKAQMTGDSRVSLRYLGVCVLWTT